MMVEDYKPLAAERRSRPLQTKYLVNAAKVTDHHALLPTEEPVELWRSPGRSVTSMIRSSAASWRCRCPPSSSRGGGPHPGGRGETLHARGKAVLSPGWRAAHDRTFALEEEDEEGDERSRASLPWRRGGAPDRPVRLGQPGQDRAPQAVHRGHPPHRHGAPGRPGGRPGAGPDLEETGGLGTPPPGRTSSRTVFPPSMWERRGKGAGTHLQGRPGGGLAPEELAAATLTAQWERRLGEIAQGREQEGLFVDEMRQFAARLVAQVKASDAAYRHDNQTRTPAPTAASTCAGQDQAGEMLVPLTGSAATAAASSRPPTPAAPTATRR